MQTSTLLLILGVTFLVYSVWVSLCYHITLMQRRRWGLYSWTVGANGNIAFEVHMHRLLTFRNPYKLYGVGPWTKPVKVIDA